MINRIFQLLLLLLCVYSLSIFSKDKDIKYIVTGNKVNMRDQPSLNSKVITQCNFGDEIELLNIRENQRQLGDQRNYFFKVNFNGNVGWINALYISNKYIYNSKNKYYCYSVLVNFQDTDTDDETLNVYYPESKKLLTKHIISGNIIFFDSGKYCFVDRGTDVFREHEFIEIPSLKTIRKLTVFGIGKVKNNSVVFNELNKISPDNYESIETVFENGIFKTTGKKEIVNEP